MVWIDVLMYVVYVLAIIAVVAAIGFSIVQFGGNIKNSKYTLFGLLGLVVIFVVSYALSSGTDISPELFEKTGSDYGSSKLIGAGMYTIYAVMALAVISIVVTEIIRPFKK